MYKDMLNEIAQYSDRFLIKRKIAESNFKITLVEDTTDISMQIEDIHTNYIRDVGFSIKSEVGNLPTLLNAGQTTNFIYKVTGITLQQAEEINAFV